MNPQMETPMPPNHDLVPCPQCGKPIPFHWGEFKRNSHLTFTCNACGFQDRATNIVSTAVFKRMDERGFTDLDDSSGHPDKN
jgi:RNase P subunit RPR2